METKQKGRTNSGGKEAGSDNDKDQAPRLAALPTFVYYNKMYGISCSGNDKKALGIFKEYEADERIKRLKSEMLAVSQNRVSEELCDRTIGKNRKARFNGYDAWAKMMLSVLHLKR